MQREAELSARLDAELTRIRAEVARLRSLDSMTMEDMQREAELEAILEHHGGAGGD